MCRDMAAPRVVEVVASADTYAADSLEEVLAAADDRRLHVLRPWVSCTDKDIFIPITCAAMLCEAGRFEDDLAIVATDAKVGRARASYSIASAGLLVKSNEARRTSLKRDAAGNESASESIHCSGVTYRRHTRLPEWQSEFCGACFWLDVHCQTHTHARTTPKLPQTNSDLRQDIANREEAVFRRRQNSCNAHVHARASEPVSEYSDGPSALLT